MPPDTSYIPGVTGQQHLDSLETAYRDNLADDGPKLLYPEVVMFLFILFIVALSAYLYIIRPAQKEKKKRKSHYKTGGPVEKMVQELQYDHWLNKYNPYYHSLPPELKKKFLHRVKEFMASKQFYFHAMVEEEYMPVLISGAAVQLTFGLRNYLMDYFDVIHVMRREYILNIDKETYYGHVTRNGIHISWSHFLAGYSDYTDATNLGLHEMAHALQFDSALGEEDHHDRSFKERLYEFSTEGRPVFRAMRQGKSHLLSDYAATNFDEFWAVSVETFFENPAAFKEKLPHLYREMSELLNQDPLLPEKVIVREMAWPT